MKTKRFLWPAVAVALALGGCSSENDPIEEGPVNPKQETGVGFELTDAEKAVASRTLGFQTDFFRAVNAESLNANQNVVTAPISAQVLMSIVANTAAEQQRDEILAALGCNDLDALNSLAAKYQTELPKVDDAVKMTLVNSLWYTNRYTVSDAPAVRLGDAYGIVPAARDFSNLPALADEVNLWAKEYTNGLIEKVVDAATLSPDMVTLLANAQYFKGEWANPFEVGNTARENFAGVDGATQVEMMKNEGVQHVYVGSDCSAVKMEFGSGKFYAMFVLPPAGTDINEFVATFNPAGISRFVDQPVVFWLPKFKFDTPIMNLNDALRALGMGKLQELLPTDFFTATIPVKYDVFQKASVSFEEKGAEGAAVTWSQMNTSTGEAIQKPEIKLNRPFLFFINETTTDACLFAGKMVKF